MKKYLFLIIIFLILPLILPLGASSQTQIEEQLSITFSPQYPGPNEFVDIDINSYQTDLDKSEISFYVNGTFNSGGVGVKSFSFLTGEVGETSNILIRIDKPNGSRTEKRYSITPGEINLYYEPQTYTPPFYKGRSEFSNQSDLKIFALANFVDNQGNAIPKNEIVYTWKINGEIKQRESGVGRDVYYYRSNLIPEPVQIILEASPINSQQISRVFGSITPSEPLILIYEKNPIYGTIFSQDIKEGSISGREEIEVTAIPYFFDEDILSIGEFEWFLNGKVSDFFDLNNIIFRRVDNNPSNNNVSVEIINPSKIMQSKKYSFDLNFDQNNDKSFEF